MALQAMLLEDGKDVFLKYRRGERTGGESGD
jgi:hypothetical protein